MGRATTFLIFTMFAAIAAVLTATMAREPRDDASSRWANARLDSLRQEFGSLGYRYEIDPEARLIYAVATDDEGFQALKLRLGEQAKALQADLFKEKIDGYVTVLLPTAKDYEKLIRFRNVPGMYVEASRLLVAKEQGYVLTHEFTHALHAADRAASGQTHALWIAEGLGTLCEAASFEGGRFVPEDNARFAGLPAAAKRKALVPLERLISMPREEFLRRPNLTYGQAGSLMLYLWEKKKLRVFYETYKSTCKNDPTGRAALEQATGLTLSELQEDWRTWLAARPPSRRAPTSAPAPLRPRPR